MVLTKKKIYIYIEKPLILGHWTLNVMKSKTWNMEVTTLVQEIDLVLSFMEIPLHLDSLLVFAWKICC